MVIMSKTLFISDPHFGHELIAKQRGFSSTWHMDIEMVRRWNSRVSQDDDVKVLGDLGFGSAKYLASIVAQLNGRIHLISGNHDRKNVCARWLLDMFHRVDLYVEMKAPPDWAGFEDDRSGRKIVLFHYPILSWNGMHRGSWCVHGHSHGNLTITQRHRVDLSSPEFCLTPVPWSAIVAHHDRFPSRVSDPVDHHV